MALQHLTSAGSILLFLYIAQAIPRYSLTDRPRFWTALVLLIAGGFCYLLIHAKKLAPKSDWTKHAFFEEEEAAEEERTELLTPQEAERRKAVSSISSRSHRWHFPALIVCLVFRLEASHMIMRKQQCMTPGVEVIACVVLMGYQAFLWGLQESNVDQSELEDPWRSALDDISDWITGPNSIMVLTFISVTLFSYGTYLSIQHITPSTYMCVAPWDSYSSIFNVQLISVALDAAIVLLLWNTLLGVKSTRFRVQVLGQILCLTGLAIMAFGVMRVFVGGARSLAVGFESLSFVTIVFDGLAFALFSICMTLWMCDTAPVDTVCVTTFMFGITKASANVFQLGTWLSLSKGAVWWPLTLIICSSLLFNKLHNVKLIAGIPRTVFTIAALSLLLVATIFSLAKHAPLFDIRHPISDLMYNARIEHDRWLTQSTTSRTLKTAAQTYSELRGGRLPPPNFNKWYAYARGSSIIDEFSQIDRDLEPFWQLSPQELRRRVDAICATTDMIYVTIDGGQVYWSEEFRTGPLNDVQSRLTRMLEKFSSHLPNMTVPINFGHSPRVIPDWYTKSRYSKTYSRVASRLISKRDWESTLKTQDTTPVHGDVSPRPKGLKRINASKFRQLQRDACPGHSAVQSNAASNFGEFCSSCVGCHSDEHFAGVGSTWIHSLDTCSQPDLRYLHGFYLSNPPAPVFTELLPLFSAAKTEEFSDILIPLAWSIDVDEGDSKKTFSNRANSLYWRPGMGQDAISEDAVRGNHRYRLLHMANQADEYDETTMLFRTLEDVNNHKMKYVFEKLPTAQASQLSRFNITFGPYIPCDDDNCNYLQNKYGTLNSTRGQIRPSRYVLLPDGDDGPSRETLKTLRSRSLPFISTIFRSWYSDRLQPWLHYVPIDPRYHALHSTAAYFTGTKHLQQINGRELVLEANVGDGEYLANQGRRWAQKALREHDMEIYLYRLLLEWGRLLHDDRDSIGYTADAPKSGKDA